MDYQIYNLLEKKNKMICDIVDIIYVEKGSINIHDLSTQLQLNERSTQRYIHNLEETILNFNLEKSAAISFEYSKFQGVNIGFLEYSSYDIKNFIIEKDLTISIFLDLIFGKFSSIQMYSQENYISDNLVRKIIKKINSFTQEFSVLTKSKPPFFYGDEKNIRLCFNIFFWSMYRDSDWPFSFIDENKVYTSIETFSEEADIHFSEIHKRQFAYLLAINNLRYHQKKFIEKSTRWDDYVNINKLKEVSMIKTGISKYNIHDENEIYFYLILIQMKTKMYESDELKERILSYHQKKKSDIYYLTELCVEEFKKSFFDISEEQEKFLFIYLFCTNLYCSVFGHVKVDIDGYLFKNENFQHKNLLKKIENHLEKMHQQTHNALFLEKEFLIAKYYMLISALDNPLRYEKEIRILLSSDFPLLMRTQVKQELFNKFNHTYNLYIHEDHEKYQDVDFVLTNFPSLYPKKETVNIDYPLSDYNLYMIEKNILKHLE